jgi:hypothetical protein
MARQGRFPRPVATTGDAAAWLLGDVRDHLTGKPVAKRKSHGLQERVLDSRRLARLLGIQHDSLRTTMAQRRWNLVPKTDCEVAHQDYWWRERVERWLWNHRPERAK